VLGRLKLQEWIHRVEEGAGARFVRWTLAIVAFALVAVMYDVWCFRNLSNAEAMDAAQLGRNIAEDRGFTTYCIRPLSLAMTSRYRADQSMMLKEGHQDISNPPVYPLLLAGLLKVVPEGGDLAAIKRFSAVPTDMAIAVMNQFLLGLGALFVFRLALGWFNRSVAWMSAILFVLTEHYWRFSVSGLSTIWLMDLILVLAWLLGRFERGHRENVSSGRLLILAGGAGLVVGLAMLTRYSTGWLLLPVLMFIAICSSQRRMVFVLATLAVCLLVVAPWITRNILLSGAPFGTQTFAVLQDTPFFPGDSLERSLKPAFARLLEQKWTVLVAATRKAVSNSRDIFTGELPLLGGNWLWSFFLAGLLVRFQSTNLNRARWFVLAALAVLLPVQALTRTHLTTEAPVFNSENLLVLVAPLVLIFGVGLFFILFDSLPIPSAPVRMGALAGFVAIISLPMLLVFLPPRSRAFAPPYYPPRMQQMAHYLQEGELLMSDVPWAMAWYGERQCVWMPMTWKEDFFQINDFQRTVSGLYVSARTTDSRFFSNWFAGDNRGWGSFFLQCFVRNEVPTGFPLKHSPERLLSSGELLLMDRDRWSGPGR
jgi:4-amino-4-deoxy-L-arabinose transferase-like glycosyltransferase